MSTKLEAAARQALEALELSRPARCGQSDKLDVQEQQAHRKAITDLREALAEQAADQRPQNCGTGFCSCIECPYGTQQAAEPVAQVCCGQFETCTQACTPRGKFLGQREALAEQQQAAEPVAWANPNDLQPLTAADVRRAGGIVHSDGNVFFTNLDMLNKAITRSKEGGAA